MPERQPLDYARPPRRRRPITAACFTFGGAALFFFRPRSPELLDFACILIAAILSIIGAVLMLKFVGELMDES